MFSPAGFSPAYPCAGRKIEPRAKLRTCREARQISTDFRSDHEGRFEADSGNGGEVDPEELTQHAGQRLVPGTCSRGLCLERGRATSAQNLFLAPSNLSTEKIVVLHR